MKNKDIEAYISDDLERTKFIVFSLDHIFQKQKCHLIEITMRTKPAQTMNDLLCQRNQIKRRQVIFHPNYLVEERTLISDIQELA